MWLRSICAWLAMAAGTVVMGNAHAFTLEVRGCSPQGACTAYTGGFRYLVEEDNSPPNLPQVPWSPANPISTLSIHKSHAPVVTSGSCADSSCPVPVPDEAHGRYFVSVLPNAGYALSGNMTYTIRPAATPADMVVPKGTVVVELAQNPLPTAQITVFANVDHNPINNTWDQHDSGVGNDVIPNGGLGGVSVRIADVGGQISADVFGNPLGTRYQQNPDGSFVLDPDGLPVVAQIGTGVITTMTARDVNDPVKNPYGLKVGEAIIKNIAAGKYGVTVVPPQFDDNNVPLSWVQTATIEGTKTIDAWVKANEPKMFIEGFGQGFNHVVFSFVKVSPAGASPIAGQSVKVLPWNLPATDPDYVDRSAYTGSISGTLRLGHFSRPPDLQSYHPGPAVDKCWVGLNATVVTPGVTPAGLYAAPCGPDGTFSISNVPPGTYQLVHWDEPLDYLWGFRTVTVPAGAGGTGDPVPLGNVLAFHWFGNLEGKVFYDANQNGFREPTEAGLPNQAVNLRFRDGSIYQATATDLTGGYKFAEVFPFFNWLVTEVDFARFKATGLTTAVDAGGLIADFEAPVWPTNGNKTLQLQAATNPVTGNNLTRNETGPVLTQAMQLFLGQTNLIDWGKVNYPAGENGGISGVTFYSVTRAENDPRYGVGETWEPGIPRVQVCLYQDNLNNATNLPVVSGDGIIDDTNGVAGVQLCDIDHYPLGWSEPGGTKGPEDVERDGSDGVFSLGDATQVAHSDSWDDSNPTGCIQAPATINGFAIPECADAFGTWNQVRPGVFDGGYAFSDNGLEGAANGPLPAGTYIVEAAPPPHYAIVKEEDKNVGFGEAWTPSPLLVAPPCVGTVSNAQPEHQVPASYSLFSASIPDPLALSITPLCNMKQVIVKNGQNTAADFHMFTEVPKAARIVGFVLNDLTAEFNAGSPVYGEKLAAKWIPVSYRDWSGREVARTYADEFGTYTSMLPSSYSINVPTPSGVSPNMITVVLNDPMLPDGTPDPYYDPTYSVSPWTRNLHPATTHYADTPIVPIRAFAAAGTGFSTAAVTGTPGIRSVDGPGAESGALICTDSTPLPQNIVLTSLGPTAVIDPVSGTNQMRDYGFGSAAGTVTLNGAPLTTTNWADGSIEATVPAGATTGMLKVARADGTASEVGVQLIVRSCPTGSVKTVTPGSSIQAAIDAAVAGDVILVAPGVYNENVVMYKPVHLQGSGAGSTFINANPNPLDRLQVFHDKLNSLGAADFVAYLMDNPFIVGEAPGVFVLGSISFPNGTVLNPLPGTRTLNPGNTFTTPGQASIDGFTILGSKAGGGIFMGLGASNVVISNNNITNNQGNLAGGIAVGGIRGFDSQNDNAVIRNNKVHANGGVDGSGGIALNDGAENYVVEGNLVKGNFSRFNGGGIAHNGYSAGNNVIRNNQVLFNEVFFGALLNRAGDGGGIFVGDDVAGVDGTGNVRIEGNLIQGNLTGAGSGAGIRAFAVNADDVRQSPANDATWSKLEIVNNMIVNNVAGLHGGGISLQDVLRATIVNNTIANNDSTATAALAFAPGATDSTAQPAGIVSAPHSVALQGLITRPGEPTYSNPVLRNNIVWHNRSYYNVGGGAGSLAANPAGLYQDYGVVNAVGVPPVLNPVTSFDSTSGTPGFMLGYENLLAIASVIDEGGNNINVSFTPLDSTAGNYHINAGAPVIDAGSNAAYVPTRDIDGDYRPRTALNPVDIGADEQPGAQEPPPVPVLTVLDTFNRANATNLGANWQQIVQGTAAGIRVNNNQAFCINNALCAGNANTGGANAVWGAAFGANQGAGFTFASPTAANRNGASLLLKASVANNGGIRVRYATGNGGQVLVQTTTDAGASFQNRGTLVGSFDQGDTMMATADATGLVTVWKTTAANVTTQLGTVQLPTTGNLSWTTGPGQIGMRLLPNRRVDNFIGGNVQ
ncbi:MAG: right-handed parallel beta-helix repeat-containing protein [Rhodocyclales bacterium]|nr:right-handed parallel beta-helix repeat-containing protein [Rhodocyclales bacterium]